MAKTAFPIELEVEEIALGTVLRKLNDMPGIIKINLNFGQGGQGAGREKLTRQATEMRGENGEQIVLKLLMEQGALKTAEIKKTLHWNGSKAYGVLHALKKKGLIEAGVDKTHRLTRKVMQLAAAAPTTPALPAPAKVKHGPKGRATPGSGNIILKSILSDGPKSPVEIRRLATETGVSPKSISGVMDRAKKAGLIKKNGNNVYELTAKGQKIEMPAEVQA